MLVCAGCTRNTRVIAEWQKDGVVKVCKDCRGATWVRDSDAKTCVRCQVPFSLMNRRHHCRRCGRIFCAGCSNFYQHLPGSDNAGRRRRVCGNCSELPSLMASVSPQTASTVQSSDRSVSPSSVRPPNLMSRVFGAAGFRSRVDDDDLSMGSQHSTPREMELDDMFDECASPACSPAATPAASAALVACPGCGGEEPPTAATAAVAAALAAAALAAAGRRASSHSGDGGEVSGASFVSSAVKSSAACSGAGGHHVAAGDDAATSTTVRESGATSGAGCPAGCVSTEDDPCEDDDILSSVSATLDDLCDELGDAPQSIFDNEAAMSPAVSFHSPSLSPRR